jgi:urease accessory protein
MGVAQTTGDALAAVRARGGVAGRIGVGRDGRSLVRELAESGGYRLALPSTFASHIEAAQINTGGGVAGGDRIETALHVESGADVVFSTQGAERIYRSEGAPAVLDVRLTLEAGARVDWLPQQTIVYAGARIERRIEADVAGTSRLLLVEVLTFGRPASREGSEPARISDNWRVRRDGRLVLAEALRLSGAFGDMLDRAAVGGGARTTGLVVLLAADASDLIEAARAAIAAVPCEAGVSTWNGLLAGRVLSQRPADAIAAVAALARVLAGRDMPRVWSI